MERIWQMSLKKSLFTIALVNSAVALVLSLLSFWGCMKLISVLAPQKGTFIINSGPLTVTEVPAALSYPSNGIGLLLSILQIALPVLIYTMALLSTSYMFYRLKLQKPLETLADGASRIMDNDLDFTLETDSRDELGQLCLAFEAMRRELLDNSRKLWQQAEERKRLNAAFSHDLRNPVTVLKGAAKLAGQGTQRDGADPRQLASQLSLIESYTERIERYVETMSSVQRLEDISLSPKTAAWDDMVADLADMLRFMGADSGKQIHFRAGSYSGPILIDSSVLFQIAENLVSNALRFAASQIHVSCLTDGELLILTVTDDGPGFPETLAKNGIRPFQKGAEDAEHFGMGLYTSMLLARRHGGGVTIQNSDAGAAVTANLSLKHSQTRIK